MKKALEYFDPVALVATIWLVGFLLWAGGTVGTDRVLALLAITAVVVGCGLPIMFVYWWDANWTEAGVIGAFAAGAVVWTLAWRAPQLVSVVAVGYVCGALIGAAGIRLQAAGSESLRRLTIPAVTATAILAAVGRSHTSDPEATAAAMVITTYVAIGAGVALKLGTVRWEARRTDVAGTFAALAGGMLLTVLLWWLLGEPAVFAFPVVVALGAMTAVIARGGADADPVLRVVATVSAVVALAGFVAFVVDFLRRLPSTYMLPWVLVASFLVIAVASVVWSGSARS